MKGKLYYFLLIISGILWGIGQYPYFFIIRYIGLVPFLYIVLYRKHYIIETLIFGWIVYIINFYWLYFTFRESGKLPVYIYLSIILLLCLYHGIQYSLISIIFKNLYKLSKYLLYSFPIVFLSVDFIYPKLFGHSIGDSQIGFLYFIQIIDIAGMSLVVIIIMITNVGLYQLTDKIIKKTKIKSVDLIFIFPLLIGIIYGIFRFNYFAEKQKTLKTTFAAMIQGNITGRQKMDTNFFKINVDRYNMLTQTASKRYSPDFIIWPESIFNLAYTRTPGSLSYFIYSNYPPLILGAAAWEEKPDKSIDLTNSCFLIKDRKAILEYDKRRLLAFGEYVPFEKKIPILRKLSPLKYTMRPGYTSSIFQINDNVKASMSICFEDTFAGSIRRQVNEGSNLMINLTNDSWFGKGLGTLHHLALARLRAIENRRSLYRCTSTGLTTASDLTGSIIKQGKICDQDIVAARVPLYDGRTMYGYIGDLLSYLSVIFTIVLIIICMSLNIRQRFKNKKNEQN